MSSFKNPPILILDEATSALDNESERRIQKSLKNFQRQNNDHNRTPPLQSKTPMKSSSSQKMALPSAELTDHCLLDKTTLRHYYQLDLFTFLDYKIKCMLFETDCIHLFFHLLFISYHFPFFNLCMIFFLTSICMTAKSQADLRDFFVCFFFSIRIIQSKSHTYNQLFSLLLSLFRARIKSFSSPLHFPDLYKSYLLPRSQNIRHKQLVSIPVNVQRFVDGHFHLCLAITPSTLKFHFQYIGMRMLQV